ncbi:putative Holliday junction resolvase [Crateriforma conspicua]|uniref:Putative pre-16S rRNA nuclease n=1 Tax=Crateriforma conspicua TaxID=2527996 RepID=A0A5C6FNT7_9PLAN|nr:putative Holliday junction resolvase [Crateriforma conspicua]
MICRARPRQWLAEEDHRLTVGQRSLIDHFLASVRTNDESALVIPSFPESGRIAAIDYGTVRIGVAICDPDRILASPLEVVTTSALAKDPDYFARMAKDNRVTALIVGLPVHCDGGESQKSAEAREFAKSLRDQTGLPVRMFDERFTTVAAQQRMRPGKYTRKRTKERVDAIAALVLLESFLEACRYHNGIAGHDVDVGPDDETDPTKEELNLE